MSVIAALMVLASCSDNISSLGVDFFNDTQLDISFIDTATVKMYTQRYDSVNTSGTQRILVGSHHEPKLGAGSAAMYMQFGMRGPITVDRNSAAYDHMTLTLYYDKYSYYDTLSPLTLNVHRVAKEMNWTSYSSVSDVPVAQPALGSITVYPRPHSKDSLEIRLNDDLGRQLFKMAQLNSDILASYSNFKKFLNGIAILPDASQNASFVGFNLAKAQLRIYYVDKSTVPVALRSLKFIYDQSYGGVHFCKTNFDRSATKLDVLKSGADYVDAALTDNESYMQDASGVFLRVEFPYLRKINENPNFYFTSAVLYLYPKLGTFSKFEPLPDTLYASQIDLQNSQLSSTLGSFVLQKDPGVDRGYRYQLNMTSYVNTVNNPNIADNFALFVQPIGPKGWSNTAKRMIAEGPGLKDYQTKLVIYYATIK